MRRALVQTGAWAVTTGAAVALSWLGVNAVLSDALVDAPAALALPASPGTAAPQASPTPAGTAPGEATQHPSDPASASPGTVSRSASRSPAAKVPVAAGTTTAASTAPSSVQSYLVPGGRLALDMHPDSADLVSATPDAGWKMEVWHGDQWMRIDFSQGSRTSSVFVTWNGHPPDVQTVPG